MINYEDLFELNSFELEAKIERAAGYVRKSRPKTENHGLDEELRIQRDLEMQIDRVNEAMEVKGWEFQLYKEVKSGENIEDRNELNRLLRDIGSGLFDVLVIVDYDRLSRGDAGEQTFILKTLRQCGVLLYEESTRKLYNPLNDADIDMLQMKGYMANNEFKAIVSRNKFYKRAGARQGNWVNGEPPFGYVRNHKTKKLEIDEEQGTIYREHILLPFLNGESLHDITWNLNKNKILSPRGKMWNTTSIARMLKSEVYCGKIVYNRTMGNKYAKVSLSKQPYREVPEDKWIVRENCHPKLKTYDEHKQVLSIAKANSRQKANVNLHAVSGIVKCYFCGQTMLINKDVKQKTPRYYFKACTCGENRGGTTDLVLSTIFQSIHILERKLQEAINNSDESEIDVNQILSKVIKLEKDIEKNQLAINRIESAWEEGEYTTAKKNERIFVRETEIAKLESEINALQKQLENTDVVNNGDKIERIKKFKEEIESCNAEDFENLRIIFYSLIDKIIWKRTDDEHVEINVNFL